MKQIAGQINLFEYVKEKTHVVFGGCEKCVCEKCLYWWSGRCPHGRCYDDIRAKEKNGWRKANGTPVKNAELWEQLVAVLDRHNVTYTKDEHPYKRWMREQLEEGS